LTTSATMIFPAYFSKKIYSTKTKAANSNWHKI